MLGAGVLVLMGPMALWLEFGCAASRLEQTTAPAQPFDAVIIPGCPSGPGGALSPCQARRAVWAALLWERGYTRHFITSGAAAHSPYVEAEALAAAMAALGVPADSIYLDPQALHTDENMYNALGLARRLGWRRLAVASDGGHARAGCKMLRSWGGDSMAIPIDGKQVRERLRRVAGALGGVRAAQVPAAQWQTLDAREADIARRTGRPRRPPSVLLYPWMQLLDWFGGPPWVPRNRPPPVVRRWSDREAP